MIGICVVRSKHDKVLKYIAEIMLFDQGDLIFSVIEIIPSKHALKYSEIRNDNVEEKTNPIHNYILRDSIIICPQDVIFNYTADPLGIMDKEKYEEELIGLGLIGSILT